MKKGKLTQGDFFFCYTKSMTLFLRGKGIPYIFKGQNLIDGKTFTLYERSEYLHWALTEFEKQDFKSGI